MRLKNESWRESTCLLFFAITIAICARTFLIAPIIVDGESMVPTLEDQDRMIINKSSYWFSEPKRFDVIVFHASEKKDYIKRVIGLPGDTLYYAGDQLYINDEKVKEPYLAPLREDAKEKIITPDFSLRQITGLQTIPEGHVFVLGDNRRHSLDSRMIGLVKIDDIVGEASITFWPVSHLSISP